MSAPRQHGATAHGTDRAAQDPARAHLDPDLAWGHHLLLVGPGIDPGDVEALALSRFPGASRRDEDTIDLIPGAWLTGPWLLDDDSRAALGLPEEAQEAYLARAPVLRAGPVPQELRGLGGLLDAFAEGTPEGDEADVVEFLFAVARRLGGALRAGGSGMVLVPDPAPFVDLIVHSAVWLEPEALQVVLGEVLPGLELLTSTGLAPLPMPPPTPEELSEAERAERSELHARADAFDAAALAAQQVHESYGALWHFGDDGVISVQVEATDVVPPVLLGVDWAGQGLLSYYLRWYPAAVEVGEEEPAVPEQVRTLIEDSAAALLIAVGGVVADDDGFLVDLGLDVNPSESHGGDQL